MTTNARNELYSLIDTLSNLLNYANKVANGIDDEETVNPGETIGLNFTQKKREWTYMQFEYHIKELVKMNPCLVIHNALEFESDETHPYCMANIIRKLAENVAKENFESFKNKLGVTLSEEECKYFT